MSGSLPPSFSPRGDRERPTLEDGENPQGTGTRSDASLEPDLIVEPSKPHVGPNKPAEPTGSEGASPARKSIFNPVSSQTPPSYQPKSTEPGAEGNANASRPPSYQPKSSTPEQASGATAKPRSYQPARPASQRQLAPRQQLATQRQPAPKSRPQQSRTGPRRQKRLRRPSMRRRPGHARKLLPALLALVVAWPIGLVFYVNHSLHRVEAATSAPKTSGKTYLFAGSDSREGWNAEDPTEGQRSDSTILVHRARNGQASMVSLPRDLYVDIPGLGMNKLNAAFAVGGPPLLVQTVEQMTGLKVDYYVEIGMGGVSEIVDSLGGVNLCWDYDVSDPLSGMEWTAGCHETDGEQALAFSRMRYEDPTGDFGRTERQRQVMGAVVKKTVSPGVVFNPFRQVQLANAGIEALTVGYGTNVWDIATLMLTMRKATNADLIGIPPIASDSTMTDVGSVVLLDDAKARVFFDQMAQGKLTPRDFQQIG